jgi:hypothetical protein
MKNLLSVLAAVLIMSCSESDEKTTLSPCSSESTSIIGNWEIRSSDGGMLPGKRYSSGNGIVTEFTETMYKQYDQGVLTFEVPYTLSASESMNDGRPMQKMILEGYENLEYRVRVDGSMLTMEFGTSLAADGVISTYERIVPCEELPDNN